MALTETIEIVWHSDGFNPPEPVYSLNFYGNYLITAGGDCTARVWKVPGFSSKQDPKLVDGILTSEKDSITSKISLVACLEGHKTPLACVRVSSCGRFLATSSSEPYIIIWERLDESTEPNKKSVTKFKKKRMLYHHEMEVFSIAFLEVPSTRKSPPNTLKGNPVADLTRKDSVVEIKPTNEASLYSPGNPLLVSCSLDNKVIVWEILTGRILETFTHSSYVKDVSTPYTYIERETNNTSKIVHCRKEKEVHLLASESDVSDIHTMTSDISSNPTFTNADLLIEHTTTTNITFEPFVNLNKPRFISYGNDKKLYLYESKSRVSKSFTRKLLNNSKIKDFYIENCNEYECDSFVRRNSWSLDGLYFLQVGMKIGKENNYDKSVIDEETMSNKQKIEHLAVVWDILEEAPVFVIRGFEEPTILSSFYPYKITNKNEKKRNGWLGHEQYFIAIATTKRVLIYDTTRFKPVYVVKNIHYTYLTDLSWRKDGLAISSSDGYVSFIKLGEEFFEAASKH